MIERNLENISVTDRSDNSKSQSTVPSAPSIFLYFPFHQAYLDKNFGVNSYEKSNKNNAQCPE